jgi:hypothetical protein
LVKHGAWILLGVAACVSACSTIFGDVVFLATGTGGAKGTGGGHPGTGGAMGTGGAETDGGCTGGSGGSGGAAPFVCDAQTVCWDLLWGNGATIRALDVTVDTAGRSYVVGQFSGTMRLDCAHTLTGDSAGDGFVVALTPSGTVSWVETISGPLAQTVSAVTVDGMGNVIVGGYTQNSVPVGNLSVSPGLFAAQFNANGAVAWVTSLGGSDGSSVDDVATAANGDVDMAGRFLGTINLGSGPAMAAGTPIAWTGVLQNSDGLALSGGTWGTGSGQVLNLTGYRRDGSGNTYIAGTFQGTISPPGVGLGPLTSAGGTDVFMVKYYPAPPVKVLSQAQYGDAQDQSVSTLAVNGSGDVLLGGQFAGTIMYADMPYTAPAGGTALFVLYGGTNLWAYSFGDGPGEVHASMDQAGQIVLAGGFLGAIDFNGAQVSNPTMNQNIFAAKLDPVVGAPIWLRSFAGSGASVAHGVAAIPFGDSIVVGEVSGAISFVDGGIEATAGTDAFVVRLGQ